MKNSLLAFLHTHKKGWLTCALITLVAYHLLWIVAMILRFGTWPNYFHVYDVVGAYRLIWSGTPSLIDALKIMLYEPWLEIGHTSVEWGISEWSFMLLPPKFLLVVLLSALFGFFLVVRREAPGYSVGPDVAAISGTLLVGLAAASLFWVVCCANPTWIVALAMLGVGNALAVTLEPLGGLLSLTGFVLLSCASIYYYSRVAANRAPAYGSIPAVG